MSREDFWLLASGADHRPSAKAQVQSNPVTELKRRQKPKRPRFPRSQLIATYLMEMLWAAERGEMGEVNLMKKT
jgi:hypothetical protein